VIGLLEPGLAVYVMMVVLSNPATTDTKIFFHEFVGQRACSTARDAILAGIGPGTRIAVYCTKKFEEPLP
jgi:hypothetical protein